MSAPVNANDVLFGSGIPAAKFQFPGDNFSGPITKLEAVQARKFDKKTNRPTDELEFWDNGDPKMVAVATLRTQHRDPSDASDDGQRKLYIASRDMQTKVRDAVKAAGKRGLDIGGFLSVTYTHEAPSDAGPMAKFYEVTYQPQSQAAANAALGAPQAYVQQAQQPTPQAYEVTYQPQSQAAANAAIGAPQAYVQQAQQPTPQAYVQQAQQYQQPVQQQPVQNGYYAEVPPIGQLMAQPVEQPAAPVQAAPAAAAPSLENLPPEAQALVQRMLAAQQQS